MFRKMQENGRDYDALKMKELDVGDTFQFPSGTRDYQVGQFASYDLSGRFNGHTKSYQQISNGEIRKFEPDKIVVRTTIHYKSERIING